jgi:hypothetical protein
MFLFFQTPVTTPKECPTFRESRVYCIGRMINFRFGLDTIFINCVAANFLSKMSYANGEEYHVDPSQLQVKVPSVAIVTLR